MSPRVFLGWLVVTVATVVAALVVGFGRETATYDALSREPVFAELRADPNRAATVVVESRFGKFALERGADGWTTPDRFGYPVDAADVRRLISGLADMRYVERKTAMPERFHRLGLEDIDAELSDSAHVRVLDDAGTALVDVIVGRPSARFFGGHSSGTYIREPGTNNTWLASGVTNVQTRLVPWLDRSIIEIPANTVARVAIGEGDDGYVLSRESAEAGGFTLDRLPEGRSLDSKTVEEVSRALATVQLEDVKPKNKMALPEDARLAEMTTFDGLNVKVRLAEIDGKYWATFAAAYTGDASEESEGAQAAREKSEAINARVGEWVYWIPSATWTALTHPLEDMLAPKEDKAS